MTDGTTMTRGPRAVHTSASKLSRVESGMAAANRDGFIVWAGVGAAEFGWELCNKNRLRSDFVEEQSGQAVNPLTLLKTDCTLATRLLTDEAFNVSIRKGEGSLDCCASNRD